jgi:hypothetical protein
MSRRLRMQTSLAVALFLLMATGFAIAAKDDRWMGVIQRQPHFTTGIGKGSPPGPSPIQRAFTSLLRHRRTADFLMLTTSNGSAARLYGLCGLKHLEAPEYADVRRRLAEDPATVSGSVGCIRVYETVSGALAHQYRQSGRTVFDVICSDLVVR